MQALPLQNFSPDLFPGLVLVLAPALGLVYSISAPNKSEAPTLPGLTQTGRTQLPIRQVLFFVAVFRAFNLHGAHMSSTSASCSYVLFVPLTYM